MIKRLLIKNYAIIESLEIDFSGQLTIITGETGAGKSILLGALELIMGKRADLKTLYDEQKKCIVEAYFNVARYQLKPFFEQNDIDYDDEVIIRRELTPTGKSRAFVNDTPVNLKVLQQLSAALIDLHQQFDALDIHSVSFQLRMIDALAGNNSLLNKYEKGFLEYKAYKTKLVNLIRQNEQSAKETDFLQFQLEELEKAELVAGELEGLEAEHTKMTKAEDIKRVLGNTHQQLTESEQSALSQLEALAQSLGSIKEFHPQIQKLYDRFMSGIMELQDLSQEFEKIAEDTSYDPQRIAQIQDRMDSIYKLQNKHHVNTVDALLDIQLDLRNRLQAFEDLSSTIAQLEQRIEEQEEKLRKLAQQLSQRRKAVVPKFEKKVHSLLSLLAMEHAQLKIQIEPLNELSSTGMDDVQFLFAPNKGSRFLPLKSVASGGELARLTLCTKSTVASAISLPTLIFDEIDTGISGDVALKMGKILKDLSERHQVVSITHTPQIAVQANYHYFVYKKVLAERTITNVKLLGPEERIREVATMLSGSPPSASAIENAKELLTQN